MGQRYIPPEGGVGASGGGPPAEGYPPEPRTDQDVIDAVCAAFFLDPDLSTHQFEVVSDDGVVTLRGYVRSEEERHRAIDVAGDAEGVRRVVDELIVQE